MIVMQDGVMVNCLPDGACCTADKERRSPLELDCCPVGFEECNGDCAYYTELY